MKRILLISAILVVMLLGACAAPVTTPKSTSTPSDTFTIRVTGSTIIYDQKEHDRRNEGYDEEYNKKYPAYWDDLFKEIPTVNFSGDYMVITSSGGSISRSVDDTTPVEYYIGGADIVSCTFQKSGESGTLKVEILKGGKVVSSEYTTADYGVVSIATR
jgi:opacity protein-like surface antigen